MKKNPRMNTDEHGSSRWLSVSALFHRCPSPFIAGEKFFWPAFRHRCLRALLGLLLFASLPATGHARSPSLHLSEKVAFFHFIDTISAWSPYCPAESVDYALLGVSRPDEEAKAWLRRYAAARKPLGYEAETGLFLWAEQGFPMDNRSEAYRELKASVEHFMGRPEYREPLGRRMGDLERLSPHVARELEQLDAKMNALKGVTRVFARKGAPDWNAVPIFLVYTLSKRSSQGGANGEGIYAEINPAASTEDLREQCGIFLHEALHKSLQPRDAFKEFAGKGRHKGTWDQSLRSKAPDEGGDDEAAMLDEILVYTLSDVITRGRDPEKEIRNYGRPGEKQFVRLWDGVRTLRPILQRQLDKPRSRDRFLADLIGAFLAKIHFTVWKAPAPTPSAEGHGKTPVGTGMPEPAKQRQSGFIPCIPCIPVQQNLFNRDTRDEGDTDEASASLDLSFLSSPQAIDMKTLVRNGRAVPPEGIERLDILIEDGELTHGDRPLGLALQGPA